MNKSLLAAGVFSLNSAALLSFLFWPSGEEPRLDFEPRFTAGWRLPEKPVTLLTFNVGFGKELDRIIDLIRKENPDIVCLQELLADQLVPVEKGLGMKGFWYPSSNHGDNGSCGKALFTRGTLSEAQTMPNPEGGSFGAWGVVEIHGGRFLVGSIHLMDLKAPRGGYPKREREIRALRRAVEKVGAPALFAGDFNNPSGSVNYDLVTKWFVDLSRESGPTHAPKLPLLRIDYVFGTREWESVESRTLKAKLSDHYPLVAVVRASRPKAAEPAPE